MYVINFIRGVLMALADSVPGVSGGTIAFIMGFYNKFISSLNALTSTKKTDVTKKEALIFLLKLGIGWVVGMVMSIFFIASIFDKEIYKISSLFTGFIIFSIPIIISEDKKALKKNYSYVIYTIIGMAIVGAITYFNPASGGVKGTSITLDQFSISLAIYIFIAGMIAISAMVLPGISGSTLLLIFGLYAPVVNAVKEVLTLNFNYLPMLIVFALGVLTGIITTIRLIKFLLSNYRAKMIYFIIGLMIGSIYAVFMGPTTLEIPKAAMNLSSFNLLFFLIGGGLIIGLQQLKVYLENKEKVS
ncbi:DUF368 domain-containing protein [Clostridium sp.]|uniref:DUF368 domain-containing protein n=1 Tax=Clostridium sp. TaxID=1506 RepID=UPI00260DFA55|nr:DUF368 domain-containing protein [Clostridium sp.]